MSLSWHDLLLLFVSPLISILVKPYWSGHVKSLVVVTVCALAAALECFLTYQPDGSFWSHFAKAYLVVFSSYAIIWRPLGLSKRLEENING